MDNKNKNLNLIISVIVALILWAMLGLIFDFYYDLNDDVLIKDIISGVYTGMPEPHNNQMMYPISLIFTLFYKVLPGIPWFGLFEMGTLAGSFIIIGVRLLIYCEKKWQKLALALLQAVFFLGVYLWEITMLQYTVVSGILCGAAAIWVYTAPRGEKISEFLKNNIPAILLAVLAFNIRSEMFLLMCPFMAAVGLFAWMEDTVFDGDKDNTTSSEKNKFIKSNFTLNFKKYLSLIGLIAAGVLITFTVDRIAYAGKDWQEFRRFFDARTEVYDFTKIPDYSANREFYENAGISKEQYKLLLSYNFDLDKSIDANMLENIADYVKSGGAKLADGSADNRLSKSIKTTLGEYIRGVFDLGAGYAGDGSYPFLEEKHQLLPMNLIVILLYATLLVIAYFSKSGMIISKLAILIAFRSVAWIYIYHKGRLVPRITHPMLMIEILILTALLLRELRIGKKNRFSVKGFAYLSALFIFTICILNGVMNGKVLREKQAARNNINLKYMELNEYTEANEGYYLIDVYSTVDFTEPIFGTKVYDKANQQLAGGWIARSPLDKYKSENSENKYFAKLEDGKWTYKRFD